VAALAASLLFSLVVALSDTSLPRWMSAVNPVTMSLAWIMFRKLLPERLARYAEGAAFNVGFLLFFLLVTVNLR
jgi:hypothetical protein